VLAVSILQRNIVLEFLGVQDVGCIAGEGLIHGVMRFKKRENAPWADSAHGNQYAEQLHGFCQSEVISAEGGTPIFYQVGEELLLFIGWNGDQQSASIHNVPQLAAGVAHGVFEKLFGIRCSGGCPVRCLQGL
jgi:hypothetical protein